MFKVIVFEILSEFDLNLCSNPYGHRHRRDMRPRGGNRAMDSRADGVMSRLGLPVGHDLKRDGNDWYRVSVSVKDLL